MKFWQENEKKNWKNVCERRRKRNCKKKGQWYSKEIRRKIHVNGSKNLLFGKIIEKTPAKEKS